MQIDLTPKEFRRLLDMVYIGNWVLNSTRGEDRFADYDDLESKLFALSPALSEPWNGTVIPSRVNFLLFYSEKELRVPLLDRGFQIRSCANYPGLGPGWYRIAVKLPEQNKGLLDAMEEILNG